MNSAKMNYKCDECGIKLNRFRDGSDEPNFRCNNCYWEDTEGEFSGNIITPDYRKEEEDEFECFSCKKMVKETEYLPSKEDEEKQQLLGNDYCLECYKKLDKD